MSTRISKPADPTRLGTVEDVSGPSVRIKLEDGTETGLVFVRGEGYRVGQVGSFVRIPAGYSDLYAPSAKLLVAPDKIQGATRKIA